jgi:hypothetical protein
MKYHTTFPSFRLKLIIRIVQIQLKNYDEAIEFPVESNRLEPLNYGCDDQDVGFEGWLALGYMLRGDFSEAEKHCAVFDERSDNFSNWIFSGGN